MKKTIFKYLILIFKIYFNLKNRIIAMSLKNYTSAIRQVESCLPIEDNKPFAILVYYEPSGSMSKSVHNILIELHAKSTNTILVSNCDLSEEQRKIAKGLVQFIITRKNIGFDFGAYKDGIKFIIDEGFAFDRLILLNDSVYYFSKDIEALVDKLLGPNDVIAAFENWEPPHQPHLQSFMLSLSRRLFDCKEFRNFWQNYRPVSNRLYAIENGEKKLSKVILNLSQSSSVIYSSKMIAEQFETIKAEDIFQYIALPKHSRSSNAKTDTSSAIRKWSYNGSLKFHLIDEIEGKPFSPIHSGFFYFMRLGCPIVKKDLVYRGVYNFWEVDAILSSNFDQYEVDEFLGMLRKKGNVYSLSALQRIKFAVGVL